MAEIKVILFSALENGVENQGQTENLLLMSFLNWRLLGMSHMYSHYELIIINMPILPFKFGNI